MKIPNYLRDYLPERTCLSPNTLDDFRLLPPPPKESLEEDTSAPSAAPLCQPGSTPLPARGNTSAPTGGIEEKTGRTHPHVRLLPDRLPPQPLTVCLF